ncbi:MAG: hypothetical protein IJ590_02060 [Rickettsiales bacterium]|nr:hypothetical protein [Rickettsiales bacterium]
MLKLFARITLSAWCFCGIIAIAHADTTVENNLYNHNIKQDDLKTVREYGCKISKLDKIRRKISVHYGNQRGIKLHHMEDDVIITIPDCYFNTKDWVLFDSSLVEPKLNILPYKERDDGSYKCKVVGGRWNVFDDRNGKYVIENNVQNIQVDHILPFSYIALNMKDCKRAGEYYNYLENIVPVLREEEQEEDDYLCRTDEECWLQTKICRNMADHFNDDVLCYKLFMDFRRPVEKKK